LAADGSVAWRTLPRVVPQGTSDRFIINEGDVLVPLRSARISSVVARGVPPKVIAAGHWAVITTGPEVLAEYLSWYLAHPSTAQRIRNLAVGSKLPFVPLAALRDLEIEVPPLQVQRRIVHAHALHQQAAELEQKLSRAREQYVNAVTRAALDRSANTESLSKP